MKHIVTLLALLAMPAASQASTAYGSLNNFDVVNDTGGTCHGFEIELEDIHSKDITYTYDWNHYGAPKITEDNSDPAHPRVFVRYESKRNPDGSFASFTVPQDPLHPLAPTDGHAFTDPSVNLGGEHFGVGYYGAPSLVKYHWLVEDPAHPGTLILGPIVNVSTPSFTYLPPLGNVPAQVQVVIEPPEPEEPAPEQFGVPVWVKVLKTVQPSGKKIKLDELVTDDETKDGDPNWAAEEPPETEIEWMVFQKRPASNPGADEIEAADELPNGDETVTRRYEFYVYNGPVNEEDGEAQCDNPDNCPDSVGPYIGAQMAGFNVETPLGLIDHLQDGEISAPYVDRTVVVGGNTPYDATITAGALPAGLVLDPSTGVLSGTPTVSGVFGFTVHAKDADLVEATKEYTLKIVVPVAVATENLPGGTEGVGYSTTLAAEGGASPFTWTVEALPAGLSLSEEGVLSGTPAIGSAGAYSLTVTVTDSLFQGAARILALTIAAAPVPPPIRGDVNHDGGVDRTDLALILAARNKPAEGPDDPRDLDGDGKITVLDARILITLVIGR